MQDFKMNKGFRQNTKPGVKGQAALEFLMTYGWAILVVLIVIGALAYFGVLNPTILLPEKCTLQMGLNCKNYLFRITTTGGGAGPKNNSAFFELENGMGKGIIVTAVNVTGAEIDCGVRADAAPIGSVWNDNYNGKSGISIPQGRSKIIPIYSELPAIFRNCSMVSRIGKAKAEIRIKWYFDDATSLFTHTMSGEILANIEDQT